MVYNRPYSRFYYRRSYGLILFVIILLVMSWESQKNDAAAVGSLIPDQSIRLRILANSDSPADQAVKRVVRDEIVAAMNSWVTEPQTIEEARGTIAGHMPEIESIVADVLKTRGFEYTFQTRLGMVPFPTKMYGDEVYPAGDYEALLVTLGDGQGQNWWCVLFPPLCFIDAATGEASAAAGTAAATAELKDGSSVKADSQASDRVSEDGKQSAVQAPAEPEAPEVKFFIGEVFQKLAHFLRGLFS